MPDAQQEARIARYKALSDAERQNVLFLLALTAGPQLDSAIWAVMRPRQAAGLRPEVADHA